MIIKYNFQQTETPALNVITHIFSRLVIPHKLTTTTNSFLLGSIDVDRNQFLGWCFSESLEKYQRIPYFVPKVPICSTSCFNKWYHSRDGKRTLLDAVPSLFGYMQISSQTTKILHLFMQIWRQAGNIIRLDTIVVLLNIIFHKCFDRIKSVGFMSPASRIKKLCSDCLHTSPAVISYHSTKKWTTTNISCTYSIWGTQLS